MKICYIASVRLPTEKAHGIQIMKMCEAFALLGHEVELILQKRKNQIEADAFDYYNIDAKARKNIQIKYLNAPELIRLGKVGFWLQTLVFSELAAIHMRRNYPDAVYSREPLVLLNLFLIHKNLVWEAHRGETGFIVKTLLKKAKLVSISWGLAHVYEKFTKKILIAPDGVNINEFSIDTPKEECKRILGLPKEKKIALYCGHLYEWKGAQHLADAAMLLTNYETAVFVGGMDWDLEDFREKNKDNPHILILGRKPHNQIPLYLRAADVLVLPNSAKEKISSHYTSPLKLFEYLASGTPIVAADLPSIREILDEKTAVFFTPDDPQSLCDAIKNVFKNGFETDARRVVEYYTWEKRAQKIINFI